MFFKKNLTTAAICAALSVAAFSAGDAANLLI